MGTFVNFITQKGVGGQGSMKKGGGWVSKKIMKFTKVPNTADWISYY